MRLRQGCLAGAWLMAGLCVRPSHYLLLALSLVCGLGGSVLLVYQDRAHRRHILAALHLTSSSSLNQLRMSLATKRRR